MADLVATVVGFEYATTKYDKYLKQEVPATPVIYVKVQMPDGKYRRISQYVSDKSMASGWPAKILGSQGLESLLPLMGLYGKQVGVYEKPSDNPLYPRPQLCFAQNPPAAAPPAPSAPMAAPQPAPFPAAAPVAPAPVAQPELLPPEASNTIPY